MRLDKSCDHTAKSIPSSPWTVHVNPQKHSVTLHQQFAGTNISFTYPSVRKHCKSKLFWPLLKWTTHTALLNEHIALHYFRHIRINIVINNYNNRSQTCSFEAPMSSTLPSVRMMKILNADWLSIIECNNICIITQSGKNDIQTIAADEERLRKNLHRLLNKNWKTLSRSTILWMRCFDVPMQQRPVFIYSSSVYFSLHQCMRMHASRMINVNLVSNIISSYTAV